MDEDEDVAVDLRSNSRRDSSPFREAIFSPLRSERTVQWETDDESFLLPSSSKDITLPPAPSPPTYGRKVNVNPSSIHTRLKEPSGSPWDFRPPRRSARRKSSWSVPLMIWMLLLGILSSGMMWSMYLIVGQGRDGRRRESHASLDYVTKSARISSCASTQDQILRQGEGESDIELHGLYGAGSALTADDSEPGGQELEIAFDYALATLGAKVLTTRYTRPISLLEAKVFGFSVYQMDSLESLHEAPLQPLVIPGRCWRFRHFPGTLVIKLAEEISIESFSLSHLLGVSVPPKRLRSAPYEFEVWGLRSVDDPHPHLLGNYTFQLSYHTPTQLYPVQHPAPSALPIVEVKILSNHGSLDYTCVYRFKVFGVAAEDEPLSKEA